MYCEDMFHRSSSFLLCDENYYLSTLGVSECVVSLCHLSLTLLIILQALFEKNPSVDQQANGTESNKSDAEDGDEWHKISDLQKR